jgi:hypothetical protein
MKNRAFVTQNSGSFQKLYGQPSNAYNSPAPPR